MREGFEVSLSELRARCDARLASLEDDLELRRKVPSYHTIFCVTTVPYYPWVLPTRCSHVHGRNVTEEAAGEVFWRQLFEFHSWRGNVPMTSPYCRPRGPNSELRIDEAFAMARFA